MIIILSTYVPFFHHLSVHLLMSLLERRKQLSYTKRKFLKPNKITTKASHLHHSNFSHWVNSKCNPFGACTLGNFIILFFPASFHLYISPATAITDQLDFTKLIITVNYFVITRNNISRLLFVKIRKKACPNWISAPVTSR